MIPKRAIFYWEGPQMSWLRSQSIATFRALNPEWEVVVLGGAVATDSLLHVAHRSDRERYVALTNQGGMYFDTDIVFCRPIPEDWLTHELVLPLGENGQIGHIAALGAAPGSPFFRAAWSRANHLLSAGQLEGYQGYGRNLLRAITPMIGSTDTLWLEHERFIPVPYQDVELLWNEWREPFPTMTVGVHWFANDPLSVVMQTHPLDEWVSWSRSLVARAWRMAMAGERETLCEQHGIA